MLNISNRKNLLKEEPQSESNFPMVGVGASAGGFDALRRMLQAVPENPNFAIIIVQHLAPDRPSLAAELLAKYTTMQVREVDDEPLIRRGYVYVIPPGKYLSVSGGRLHLSNMEIARSAPTTIDFLFRSLAKDQQQCAIGVVLSGTGSDGTLGIKAIKANGGFAIAQDPSSAEQDGMPISAIETGLVDQILTPEQIPDVLARLAQHAYISNPIPKVLPSDNDPLDSSADNDYLAGDLSDKTEIGLNAIIELMRQQIGRDFRNYKHATLLRRTRRRMCLHHTESFDVYLNYLRQNDSEVKSLARDLLINVTEFFRDKEAWSELAEQVIPEIVRFKNDEHADQAQDKNDDSSENTIRVWVPGCSTGEEAYTIAILVMDEIRRQQKSCGVQIFASDINKPALQEARAGRYPASIQAELTPQQMNRYFSMRDGDLHYQVNKNLREAVVFAEQNLISDPPFSHLDLICCRNVLIYLKPDVQQNVIGLFHFALRRGGYLMLGSAETVGRQDDLFQIVNKRWRIYRGIGAPRHDRLVLPISVNSTRRILPNIPTPASNARIKKFTQTKLLDLVAPNSVLVDRNWQILYISGNVDPYLSLQPGIVTDDLLTKMRSGLRSKLRGAIHKAFAEKNVVSAPCRVENAGELRDVRVDVRYLHDDENGEEFALIIFADGVADSKLTAESSNPERDKTSFQPTPTTPAKIEEAEIVGVLEAELSATKSDLRMTIEQFDMSRAEFEVANEEVMSVNEELQSTNEELETSKEELQSLNEEMATVNHQLAGKVNELETKHADLENLIRATDVATVCLDKELSIRWFTDAAQRVVRLKHTDIGRPLADLHHDFVEDDLAESCARVLRQLTPLDQEVVCHDGRGFLRRIVPYHFDGQSVGGVVITLVDITARKQREEKLRTNEAQLRASESELRYSEERLRLAALAARLGWYSFDVATNQVTWSGELRSMTQLSGDEPISLDRIQDLVHIDDRGRYLDRTRNSLRNESAPDYRGEFRIVLKNGETLWIEDRGRVVWGPENDDRGDAGGLDDNRDGSSIEEESVISGRRKPLYAVGIVMDVTDRKLVEAQLRHLNDTLEQQVAERTEVLESLQYITRVANESRSTDDAIHAALARVAKLNGCYLGHVWQLERRPDRDTGIQLNSSRIWYFEPDAPYDVELLNAFKTATEQMHVDKTGEGWLAQMLESKQLYWSQDLNRSPLAGNQVATSDASDSNDHRFNATSLPINTAIFLPITIEGHVVAVMELFADKAVEPSPRFLEIVADIGIQLGHLIHRKQLEMAVAGIALEEQRRIGRELHDSIAQQLTGGALIAAALRRNLPDEPAVWRENVQHLFDILQEAHQDVRHLSSGLMLSSMEASELLSVLQSIVAETRDRFEIECEMIADDFDKTYVTNNSVALAIYQIAREIIHNAVKHAGNCRLTIEVTTNHDEFRMTIEDDGDGFDFNQAQLNTNGLRIIKYRAESIGGAMKIKSTIGVGTKTILTLPRRSCQ